jgi:hypothetical protein
MKTFTYCTATALIAIGLLAPLANADDHQRYYDKAHKDYHEWNDNEEKSYAKFREERHIPQHDFAKAKATERAQYWQWRHDHPDDKR